MKEKIHHILLFSLAAVFAACASEDTFQPGPEVKAGCQDVRFATDNATTVMLSASEDVRTATFRLVRSEASSSLTVPLHVVSSTEGLTIPSTVEFAAGEQETSITLTTPAEVSEGTTYNFDVELQGDEINPYTEGATRFSGSIAFPIVRVARMNFTNYSKDVIGVMRQEFYDLGDGRLCAKDFLESNTDVWLLFDKNSTATVDAVISATPSLVEADTSYPGCNYIYLWDEQKADDESANYGWDTFYPHGRDAKHKITALTLYTGDEWTVYNPVSLDGWFGVSELTLTDASGNESTSYWDWLNFKFIDDETDAETDYSEPDPTSLPVGTALPCKASLFYDDGGVKTFAMDGVVMKKNDVRFDNFLGSGKTVRIIYDAENGTFDVKSDYGYVKDDVWYFQDEATGQWLGGNVGTKTLSLAIALKPAAKYDCHIAYATKTMKFYCPKVIVNGKDMGADDFLQLVW